MPLTIEMRWAIMISASSSMVYIGRVGEVMAMNMIGESAGLTLR